MSEKKYSEREVLAIILDLPEIETEGGKLIACNKLWVLEKFGFFKSES
jgi:hypothetical protein